MTTITKHKGKTKDTRGMEFEYTCYEGHGCIYDKNNNLIEKDGIPVWGVREATYIDNVFGHRASTLNELKKIMGTIG